MKSLNSPNLTQNLNYYKDINYLCFDNNKNDEIIYFETEENNLGTLLKFRKLIKGSGLYNYHYVGVCSNLGTPCTQGKEDYKRLCLYNDPANALPFKFEVAPQDDQLKSIEEIHKEVLEMEEDDKPMTLEQSIPTTLEQSEGEDPKIETFNDLSSLYSLGSNITTGSLMDSLPGMDYGDNFHEYK